MTPREFRKNRKTAPATTQVLSLFRRYFTVEGRLGQQRQLCGRNVPVTFPEQFRRA